MKNIITLILKRSDQTHYQSFEFKDVLGVLTERPICEFILSCQILGASDIQNGRMVVI